MKAIISKDHTSLPVGDHVIDGLSFALWRIIDIWSFLKEVTS
jgi:hypothetical protein